MDYTDSNFLSFLFNDFLKVLPSWPIIVPNIRVMQGGARIYLFVLKAVWPDCVQCYWDIPKDGNEFEHLFTCRSLLLWVVLTPTTVSGQQVPLTNISQRFVCRLSIEYVTGKQFTAGSRSLSISTVQSPYLSLKMCICIYGKIYWLWWLVYTIPLGKLVHHQLGEISKDLQLWCVLENQISTISVLAFVKCT